MKWAYYLVELGPSKWMVRQRDKENQICMFCGDGKLWEHNSLWEPTTNLLSYYRTNKWRNEYTIRQLTEEELFYILL